MWEKKKLINRLDNITARLRVDFFKFYRLHTRIRFNSQFFICFHENVNEQNTIKILHFHVKLFSVQVSLRIGLNAINYDYQFDVYSNASDVPAPKINKH